MAYHRIVDNSDLPESSFSGASWEHTTVDNAYMNTLSTYRHPGGSDPPAPEPSLQYTFNGTEIRIVGRPFADLRMNYTLVSVGWDGSVDEEPTRRRAPTGVDFSGSPHVFKDGITLFNLSNLTFNAVHTLTLHPYRGTLAIDYISYLAPPLSGSSPGVSPYSADNHNFGNSPDDSSSTMFQVDDSAQSLRFSPGDWTKVVAATDQPIRGPGEGASGDGTPEPPRFVPLGPGYTSTSVVDANVEFDFEGNEVTVCGPIWTEPSPRGSTTVSWTILDGDNRSTIAGPVSVNLNAWLRRRVGGSPGRGVTNECLIRARAPGAAGPKTFVLTVLQLEENESFNLDFLTFGTNRTSVAQSYYPSVEERGGSRRTAIAAVLGLVASLAAIVFVIASTRLWRSREESSKRDKEGSWVKIGKSAS